MSTSTIVVNCAQAKETSIRCIQAGLTPFLQSSPGMGKSSIYAEIANDFNLKLIDYRISSADPTDFNGYPQIDKITNTATYVPFDTFPVDTTPLPFHDDGVTEYDGWLLLMDELNHGNPSILRAAYKLILDRKVGQRNLHKNLAIVAAGNLATDNAMTNKLGSALDSRVIQLYMQTDPKEFLKHASSNNYDHRVTSFLAFKPDAINMFNSDTPSGAFPCQRTWEFVSKLVKKIPDIGYEHLALLSGAVGEGAAREFFGFTKVYQDLPSFQDIVANPNSAKVPTAVDCQFAVTGLLGANTTAATAKAVVTYTKRLATEFSVVALREIITRNPALLNDDSIKDWIEQNKFDIV